jgi:hypothetical protein
LNCPVWVVVPDKDPEECTVIPVGRVPETRLHEYGTVPPEAVRGFEYAVPVVALDRATVVMLKACGGVMVTEAAADLVESARLVAVTVALVLVETAGAV